MAAKVVFWCGVSEMKCIVFKQYNTNPCETYWNYAQLSIAFHSMIILERK